ncbi:MAG: choice-of-anchor K domain-containing protein, partial [Cyanobacteriota bacterium]|nr:choice-of-anchor K domain-containing protein [Cyanobacteriota bacterium]
YYFEGITTTSISLDASYFTLGTFVHYNYPVTGSISSVTLQLTVNINGVNANFCFEFRLNKALYQQGVSQVSPQTPGVSQSPPDIVSIPNTQSKETVIIDGKQYVLSLSGFFQNNQIESGFTSFANQVNVAQLLGKFVEVKSSVSELSSQNLGVR